MWSNYASNAYVYLNQIIHRFNTVGEYLPPLLLRLILAIEFGSAGLEKFNGSNWFSELSFPFPFNLLPSELSWTLATYFEIIGAVALILGLATRFFSVSLLILTIVAIASVHWASAIHSINDLLAGYRIIDEEGDGMGNYKLPLIYIVMFLPLIFSGAGRLSLDRLILNKFSKNCLSRTKGN